MSANVIEINQALTTAGGELATVLAGADGSTAAQTPHQVHYDRRVLRSLRRIMRSIEVHSRQLAVTHQITAPQLVCLLAVLDQGPLTATAISREMHLSPSTVVGILDRLEEKGWVVRTRIREDRRIVMISATEAGADLARRAPSPLQGRMMSALNALSELERATIALSLERVVSLMEEQVADPAAPIQTGISSHPVI